MPSEANLKAEGLRQAHSDGYTDICYSPTDGSLVTGGDDGYACIWSANDESTQHELGDSVSCLSINKEMLHAVVANNTLSEFDFPTCSFKRICLKLSDQITHFSPNSSYSTLAVASSDFKIRLLDRESLSVPTSLSDHQAPVLSVAFSPATSGSGELLASSSCDSTVRLWSVNEGKCISTFGRVLPKSNDVANSPTLCRLQFSNDATRLYVPTEGEIKVYDVRNWHKPCEKIDLPKKTSVSSVIRFSRSGSHFAAICKDMLAIYSVPKSHWIARFTHSKPLCAVAWHPFESRRLAFTDNRGQLGFLSAPVEEGGGSTTVTDALADLAEDDDATLMLVAAELGDDISRSSDEKMETELIASKETAPSKTSKEGVSSKPISKDFDLSDDESISSKPSKVQPSSKAESKKSSKKKLDNSDDEEVSVPPPMEDDDDDAITDLGRIRNEFKEFFDEDEDDDDDEGGENSKQPSTTKSNKALPPSTSTPSAKGGAGLLSNTAPALAMEGAGANLPSGKPADSHLQKPFQVSSTPTGRGGQNSRFLVWNQLGVVRLYESDAEGGESSVEVEFHDTSIHPPISLSSADEFTLAALTADVLVLSTSSAVSDGDDDDSETTCRLRVLTLSAWDSSREWLCDLPSGEKCVAIAIGSNWIAAVTNKQFIRLFSLAGFQLGLLSLAGPPVTATGKDDSLVVVYHNGIGAFQNQNLSFDLYKMMSRSPKLIAAGALPISSKSTLTWAGFGADFGTIFSSDSTSILRAYSTATRSWTPVANLRKCGQVKSRSDHYWVVGVSEKQQHIFTIFCKAGTFPPVLPRPILSTVPLGVPVCDAGTDSGKLADEAIRLRFFSGLPGHSSGEDSDIKLQETLMRLFAIAIKQERQCRAAEIAESMPSSHAIQLAGKYAARLRLGHLADVLNEMAMKREVEVEQAPEEDFGALLTSDYGVSSGFSTTTAASSHVEKPYLPVLATPPVVTLVKRPHGAASSSALANDYSSSSATTLSRSTFEATKDVHSSKSSSDIPAKDQAHIEIGDEDEDGDDDVQVVAEKDKEKERDNISSTKVTSNLTDAAKTPKEKVNPFKSRMSVEGGQLSSAGKPQVATPVDPLACFERAEPQRQKAPQSAQPSAAESSRKKKASAQPRKSSGGADDAGEDGPAAPKKKRTTNVGSKRKSSGAEVDSEAGSRLSNTENEDTRPESSGQAASGEDSAPAKTVEKKKATAPASSTMRKLTDFMFSKD